MLDRRRVDRLPGHINQSQCARATRMELCREEMTNALDRLAEAEQAGGDYFDE